MEAKLRPATDDNSTIGRLSADLILFSLNYRFASNSKVLPLFDLSRRQFDLNSSQIAQKIVHPRL